MTSLRVFLLTLTLLNGALSQIDYSECGKQRDGLEPEIKIVGGKEAQPGEYPWQAALYRFDRRICGATVIHPYWIVTAAHCVDVINDPPIFDYLVGSNSISKFNESQYYQFRETEEVYVHPNYRLESSDYDIALMKMSTPFEWDDDGYVYPACVPSADMDPDFSEGTQSVITGWGATREGGPQSDMLNEVTVPVVSQAECNASYEGEISDYMICAGLPEGGKDSCQGDSGGPMVAFKDGLWYLIGVVSWGTGCAREGYPGVYARVTSFADWIEPIFSGGVPDGMPVGQCPDEDFQCSGGICITDSWRCDGYRDCYYSTDESYCESALKAFDVFMDKSISENSPEQLVFKGEDSNACAMRCLEQPSPPCLAFDVLDELDENNQTQCILALGDYITDNQTEGRLHFVRSPVDEPGSVLTSALGTILTPAYSIDTMSVDPGVVRWTISINGNEYNHLVFNFISVKAQNDPSSCDDIATQNLVVIRPEAGNADGTITQCLSQVELDVDYELEDEDAVLELYSHDPLTYGFVVDYRASWFCDSVETMAPGYLLSPRYGIGEYPRNVRCRSRIQAPMGQRVHLEVEFFRIEFNGNIQGFCPSDWDTLTIYDGPDDTADRLGKYCGDLIPSEFWSTSDSMYIVFKSDSSAQETGYKLNYYFVAETNDTESYTTHMLLETSTPTVEPFSTPTEEPSSSSSKPEMTETEKQIQDLEDSLKAYKIGISAVMMIGTMLVGVLIASIVTISRRENANMKKMEHDEKNGSNSSGSLNEAFDSSEAPIEAP